MAGIGTMIKGVGSMAKKGFTKVAGKALGNVYNYAGGLVKKGDKAANKIRKSANKASTTMFIDGLKGVIHEGAPMCDPLIFAQSETIQCP